MLEGSTSIFLCSKTKDFLRMRLAKTLSVLKYLKGRLSLISLEGGENSSVYNLFYSFPQKYKTERNFFFFHSPSHTVSFSFCCFAHLYILVFKLSFSSIVHSIWTMNNKIWGAYFRYLVVLAKVFQNFYSSCRKQQNQIFCLFPCFTILSHKDRVKNFVTLNATSSQTFTWGRFVWIFKKKLTFRVSSDFPVCWLCLLCYFEGWGKIQVVYFLCSVIGGGFQASCTYLACKTF